MTNMKNLYTTAIRKASEVRLKAGLDLFEPLNIYDLCLSLGIDIRFVDINMEGLYINNGNSPQILISSLRPFSRRAFTCGHELGHHIFNHGLKVDILIDSDDNDRKSVDEILVDAFSAALIMPLGGVQSEFSKRKLSLNTSSPLEFYSISSVFGVGYQTLVTHCRVNNLINEARSIELLKLTPSKIFKSSFQNLEFNGFFKIIDRQTPSKTVDLETSNMLILPKNYVVDERFLEKKLETDFGNLFLTTKSGISSAYSNTDDDSFFIRVQPKNYVGFAEYRHLQN